MSNTVYAHYPSKLTCGRSEILGHLILAYVEDIIAISHFVSSVLAIKAR